MATERSGRQDRAEARRERILRATLEVIGEAGIAAVTHRAVAGRADVPLGSMTYYFASKDDLLRESLLLFVEEEVVRLHALAESIVGSGLTVEQIAQAFAEELASHAHAERVLTVAQFELYLESARNERTVRKCCPAMRIDRHSSAGGCAISCSTGIFSTASTAPCPRRRCRRSRTPAITCSKTSAPCWCRRFGHFSTTTVCAEMPSGTRRATST